MQSKTHSRILSLALGGVIAALYVALTYLSALLGLSGQNLIQFRLSEVLTILPFFSFAAVPGVTIGCLLANIFTGAAPWDVVFGTLASLIGAVGTHLIGKYAGPKLRFTASIPPILSNTLIVPFVVYYCYGLDQTLSGYSTGVALLITAAAVLLGEFVCCGILGTALQAVLLRYPRVLGGKSAA
ncbi:MAG: QueT transporter family protein [Clostridia bacterium]|nr:QueT transporter family protein [Clostridia bacterium]